MGGIHKSSSLVMDTKSTQPGPTITKATLYIDGFGSSIDMPLMPLPPSTSREPGRLVTTPPTEPLSRITFSLPSSLVWFISFDSHYFPKEGVRKKSYYFKSYFYPLSFPLVYFSFVTYVNPNHRSSCENNCPTMVSMVAVRSGFFLRCC